MMAAKQPPPLMKKHSQTDLVSRLKTRKILGVGGEDDDGEVHRSKISQVLGNEIKFAVREPLGLRVWQFVSAVLFSGIAVMALAFPDQLYDAVFDGAQVTSKTPIRLYGGALLSISLIMWNALYTAEKVIIRWTLLTEACYFGVQFLDYLGQQMGEARTLPARSFSDPVCAAHSRPQAEARITHSLEDQGLQAGSKSSRTG
ncbi:tumor protein p53-inducible protein 11 isoform X2 [Manis pentadactyla]|uniref:tumor protein p53-inducible protein 11 isoform X2 n=1 Tax=Manis pentadactyla TaxID=143292 RepID=UPI00255CC2BC|nr:tumor protein p53-inducible protein 11 isoform X2 [Manis pentadactyla]